LSKSAKIRTRAAPNLIAHRKLVINKQGMSNYDILTLQSEQPNVISNLRLKPNSKLFYPWCGRGVLKAELDFLLGRYDNIDFRKELSKNMVRVPLRSSLNKTVNKMRLKKRSRL
jgi:hypothetical protein